MSLLPDYTRQAERYDETRAASPSVLAPLREALHGAPGRRLADIGGGTDNYALGLSEARRIVGPGGRVMLMGFTGEDAASLWVLDYFPCNRPWMEATHPPRAALLEQLPGASLIEFSFSDLEDASVAALSR